MTRLKLKVNEQKTKGAKVPRETFDFLGYTMGLCYTNRKKPPYVGPKPSKKKVSKICDAITEATANNTLQ